MIKFYIVDFGTKSGEVLNMFVLKVDILDGFQKRYIHVIMVLASLSVYLSFFFLFINSFSTIYLSLSVVYAPCSWHRHRSNSFTLASLVKKVQPCENGSLCVISLLKISKDFIIRKQAPCLFLRQIITYSISTTEV